MSELGKPISLFPVPVLDDTKVRDILNDQSPEDTVARLLAKMVVSNMTPEERADYDAYIAMNLAGCKILDQLHTMHHAVGLNDESWIATSAFDENEEHIGFAVVWMGPKAIEFIRAFNAFRGDPDLDAGTIPPSKLPVPGPSESSEL